MRVLELFSGTGSVGNVCRARGMDVVSLDRDMPAAIRCNILDWVFRAYEPKSFDCIWAFPPCTEYSIAKTTGVRDIEQATRESQRTIDIIISRSKVLGHREPSDREAQGASLHARAPLRRHRLL